MSAKNTDRGTKRKALRTVLIVFIAVIVLLSAGGVGICLFTERPAVQTAAVYQDTYRNCVIRMLDDGGVEILPQNSAANKTGIIFYVGAEIRPDAYIPLLSRLAEQGHTCFLPNLTFNMALMEPNAAEEIIIAHPEIESWVLAGHSLGGLTASGFVDDHRSEVSGLILIAAYTNRDMRDFELPTLSVFGDTDGVLNKELYEKRRPWNTKDFEEHIIPGANHAQYGDYGKQPRDNDALISADEQQTQTADIILDWLKRHNMSGE